jgi:hypothetical protein
MTIDTEERGFYTRSGSYITYRLVRARADRESGGTRIGEKIPLREALQLARLVDEFESGATIGICPLEI